MRSDDRKRFRGKRILTARKEPPELGYGIDVPMRLEEWGGRAAPAHYLADVERAMTARLEAGPAL